MHEQRGIEKVELERTIAKIKCGKAAGIDGITQEMVKHGGDAVVEWIAMICDLAWRQGEVPDEWRKAIIVPQHTGKSCRSNCNNFRLINKLSVPGKIYGRIMTESN